jgi:hypothetical protein
MPQATIRVRAVDNSDGTKRLVQMCTEQHQIVRGVYVGRNADLDRSIIEKGVVLPKSSHWLRLIDDGDLELLEDPALPEDADAN